MPLADWAEQLARRLLEDPLPRRWQHTRGVARIARTLAPILGTGADLLRASAWLHDIGYAPSLAVTGFHQLDGARYLRDTEHADQLVCQLVAHHTCAANEAEQRGLSQDLATEFALPPPHLVDAIIYCDMTTDPDGRAVTIDDRIAEILERYGPDDLVARSITRSAPELRAAVERVTIRLAAHEEDSLAKMRTILRLQDVSDPEPHRPVHLVAGEVA